MSKLLQTSTSTVLQSPNWVAAGMLGMTIVGSTTSDAVGLVLLDHDPRTSSRVASVISQSTSESSDSASYVLGWSAQQATSAWYFELSDALDQLFAKPAGWKGPHSHAANEGALFFTRSLLWKLAHESIDRRPSLGLDHEGTFSLMWLDETVRADLTVYDDGTYSFFAEFGDDIASADDADVREPLHSGLLSALLS